MSISFIASCLQTQPRPDFDSAIEEGLNEREKDLKMQKEQAEKNKTIKSDNKDSNKDGKKSSSES